MEDIVGSATGIRQKILRFISILIDLIVVKIEMATSGRKPMLSKRIDLSDLNRPEFFERPRLIYDAGLKPPEMEIEVAHARWGIKESHFKFRSETVSGDPANDVVHGRIFEAREMHGGEAAPCFIVMHGWREPGVFTPYHWLLGILLARFGINCALMTQPWHGRRKPKGTADGDLMLCGDMERTINSFRQAVGDVRSIVTWARTRFKGKIGVGGFSLGGFVTGLVACVEDRIDFAVPIIASGNLVEGMWESPIVQELKRDLDTVGISEKILRDSWRIISPVQFMPLLSPDKIQLIAGRYDILIPVKNVEALYEKWDHPRLQWLPCGHVSIFLCARKMMRTIIEFVKGQ
jgi:hypothetical protein